MPINLNRGTCRTCGTLILEHLAASPLSVVIGRTWEDPQLLPPARGHIFYEARVADIDDGLPKRSGYMSSELAALGWNMTGMLGRSQLFLLPTPRLRAVLLQPDMPPRVMFRSRQPQNLTHW